jgi:O-methyltransferase
MSVVRSLGKRILPHVWTAQLREWRASVNPNRFDIERRDRRTFMRKAFTALSFNGVSGDYLEFGCWGGVTFALAYEEMRRAGLTRQLWAFDSFEGLPPKTGPEDEHPVWNAGALAISLEEFQLVCRDRGIPRQAYDVVPGFYERTLSGGVPHSHRMPNDVAFAYVDCDMYSSTSLVLQHLAPFLKNSMIIAFDDYYCASTTALSGERRALLEFIRTDGRFHFLPYAQFGWHGMSFLVEDRRLLPQGDDPMIRGM